MKKRAPVSLDEWNMALVSAIFLDPARANSTLSRIDATERVFEELAGTRTKEETKKSFINAFGNDARQIRIHFENSTRIMTSIEKNDVPPHFAALYLTLLAASADNETYEEGNFRTRFSILLGIDELKSFHFSDLPVLWLQLADWSCSRRERKRDCVQLILPEPPQSEKLIGHSKRLSFPSYKDEIRLRELLCSKKLDSHSPFEVVNHAVYRSLTDFNEVFISEHKIFSDLLQKTAYQEAWDTPFWGTVRDITLHEEKQLATTNGQFCFQLDISDPKSPEIYLLMDDIGANILGKLDVHVYDYGNYSNVYYGEHIDSTLNSITSLLHEQKNGLIKSRAGKALSAGCLLLFYDTFGTISSDGRYTENGLICLIILSEYTKDIFKPSIKKQVLGQKLGLDEWDIILFDSLDSIALTDLIELLPNNMHHILDQGWVPPKPYLAGGARFGQAVLLNPASTPFIRMTGAIKGHYSIKNLTGNELISGELAVSEKGLYINPKELIAVSGQSSCRYELILSQQVKPIIYNIYVLENAPRTEYRKITDRDNWLVDGVLGVLESLETVGNNKKNIPDDSKLMPIGDSWSLWQKSDKAQIKCTLVDHHAIPSPFNWLAEALALRFTKRKILPFEELDKHIESVATVTNMPIWRLRRMLLAAGWLRVVESRHTPYQMVSRADRTISYRQDVPYCIARISGMFTKNERYQLQNFLVEGEQVRRWSVEENFLALGCIELVLLGINRTEELIEKFNLHLVTNESWLTTPLSGLLQPLSLIEHIPSLPSDINIDYWHDGINSWSKTPSLIGDKKNSTLMLSKEKQRKRYFIRTNTGCWKTDSFAWALMIKQIYSEKKLGGISINGDIHWSKNLITLPFSLTQWWLHFGGGCISEDNGILFIGGGNSIWGDIIINDEEDISLKIIDSAMQRRIRALKLRKYILK